MFEHAVSESCVLPRCLTLPLHSISVTLLLPCCLTLSLSHSIGVTLLLLADCFIRSEVLFGSWVPVMEHWILSFACLHVRLIRTGRICTALNEGPCCCTGVLLLLLLLCSALMLLCSALLLLVCSDAGLMLLHCCLPVAGVHKLFVMCLQNSKLYQVGPSDTLFSLASFARWVTNAVWHSLVLSLVPTYAVRLMGLHIGQTIDSTWPLGALVFTCSVIVINVRLMLETRFWIWAHWFCFAFGIVTFFIYSFVISLIHVPMLSEGQTDYGVASMLYSQSIVWFTILLTCIMALVPDIGWILYWFTQGLQVCVLARYPTSSLLVHLCRCLVCVAWL